MNDATRADGGAREPQTPLAEVAAAMNRVLAAERAAQATVEATRLEAQAIVAEGRRRARNQLEQAERLAQLVHGRTEKVATLRAERLVRDAIAATTGPRDGGDARIATAVARLAARLTGAGDG